jgi:hypothetical protein
MVSSRLFGRLVLIIRRNGGRLRFAAVLRWSVLRNPRDNNKDQMGKINVCGLILGFNKWRNLTGNFDKLPPPIVFAQVLNEGRQISDESRSRPPRRESRAALQWCCVEKLSKTHRKTNSQNSQQ